MPRSRERASAGATRTIEDKILYVLRRRAKKGVRLDSLVRAARLSPPEAAELPAQLASLQQRGIVIASRDGLTISLSELSNLVTGTLRIHPDGYGFLATDDRTEQDYYIPRSGIRPAMDRDRVQARVERRRRQFREARIVTVLERAAESVIGTYHAHSRAMVIEPRTMRLPYPVRVVDGRNGGAREGELVVGRIVSYPSDHRGVDVEITTVLGAPGQPKAEIEAILHAHHLPTEFPPDVTAAAERVEATVGESQLAGRVDFREKPFVTIDGENARDFDDAVALERHEAGFRLLIAIADVAHYVRPGGVIDREAAERATSVYFPDRVVPMLPEALSNGICSLNPGVDRLTTTVILDYDRQARLARTAFHHTVIRSVARMTYSEVKAILVEDDQPTRERHSTLVPMLRDMEDLCRLLMRDRRHRGSIDFDLPEAEVVLDLTGRTEAILRAERHIGHQLIEEFMIAANTAVADELKRRSIPSLHRIHEPPAPERVLELSRFLVGLRLPPLPPQPSPKDVQRIVSAAEGRPEERLVNTLLLRSMKQARYWPEPLGHFGLATQSYTHFTSPIRRYPDLVVHRILGELIERGSVSSSSRDTLSKTLDAIAEHSSRRERIAMEAERECVELKKVEFMQDRIGEEFEGHISGVQPYGMFVELKDFFVEGLVHLASLHDDHYEHRERDHSLRGRYTGRLLQLGDPVTVRLLSADSVHRRIDFALVTPELGVPIARVPRRMKKTRAPKRRRP